MAENSVRIAMGAFQNLASRWRSGPATADLDATFHGVLRAVERAVAEHDRLAAKGTLTAAGVAEKWRKSAEDLLPIVADALRTVDVGRAQLQAKRQSMSMPKIDRNDENAFRIRAECRQFLLGLSIVERQAVLLRGDPDFVAAANEGPRELAGVTQEMREQALDLYLRQHHQAELDLLNERSESLDALSATAEMAMGTLRTFAGLPNSEMESAQRTPPGGKPLPSFPVWAEAAGKPPTVTPEALAAEREAAYERLAKEGSAQIDALFATLAPGQQNAKAANGSA